MSLFQKSIEPIFLKENSSADQQLKVLEELHNSHYITEECYETKKKIISAGAYGEKQIAFELKNSHIPMFIIHDLYLEKDGITSQIDYLIITENKIFVVECKNLYGDIEINSKGDFIRTVAIGNKKHREGIYSPITQNERHLQLIKQVRHFENPIRQALFEKNFYNNYVPIVVLANPKTVLNDRYAKREVKEKVIRADALIKFIKDANAKDGNKMSENQMREIAEFFLDEHIEKPIEKELLGLKTCEKCGKPMVVRTATKGPNAGNQFYGCSSYPACKNIVGI